MARRHPSIAALPLLALLLAAAPPPPEPAQSAAQTGLAERIAVDYVLVPVVVRSPTGPVRDLQPADFRLWADGEPIAVESFDGGPQAPVEVLFLQDLSGSMGIGGRLELARQAIDCVLGQQRPGDRFALATFASGRVEMRVPWTDAAPTVAATLAPLTAWGTTALHDAVSWLPELAPGGSGTHRAAVLLTDGLDNASLADSEQARDKVRQAQLPVYVVGFDKPLPGAGSPGEHSAAAQVLRLLAFTTGARYHAVTGEEELARGCADIVSDLRYQYVLGFSTEAGGETRYRELRVEVRGDYQVTFRRGYTGRPPLTPVAPGDVGQ